jgi:UDP-glucose 4-epimerase
VGRPLPIFGDGTQSRDFTFVGSVIQVLATAAISHVSSDRPVNLAFGTRTSLLDLVALLGEVLGRELDVEHRDPRAGDVPHSQADQTRFRQLFPDVQPVPLVDGLAATVDWFRAAAFHETAPADLT